MSSLARGETGSDLSPGQVKGKGKMILSCKKSNLNYFKRPKGIFLHRNSLNIKSSCVRKKTKYPGLVQIFAETVQFYSLALLILHKYALCDSENNMEPAF